MIKSQRDLLREMESTDWKVVKRARRELYAIVNETRALNYIQIGDMVWPLTPAALRAHQKYAGTDWDLPLDSMPNCRVADYPWRPDARQ